MRGVHHHHVHAGVGQLLHARVVARAARNGRGHAQAKLFVAVDGRVLVLHDLLHVREGVEAHEPPGPVHERQLADLVRAHDLVRLLERGAGLGGNGGGGHHVSKLRGRHRRVAHVRTRDHAHEALLVVQDRKAVELQPHALLLRPEEADVVVRMEADWLGDEAVEIVLHLGHLRGLLVVLQVLVNHANAAGKRHRDRHRRLCNGVHCRREKRNVHLLTARELRLKRGIVRQEIGILRDERHVVVGEPLVGKGLHEFVQIPVLGHGLLLTLCFFPQGYTLFGAVWQAKTPKNLNGGDDGTTDLRYNGRVRRSR